MIILPLKFWLSTSMNIAGHLYQELSWLKYVEIVKGKDKYIAKRLNSPQLKSEKLVTMFFLSDFCTCLQIIR